MRALFALLAAVALAACGVSGVNNVADVEKDDPATQAAHADAQRTFPSYLESAAAPAPDADKYLVKARIEDANGVEHFWLKDVARKGAGFEGVIDNAPDHVKSVKLSQRH